MTGGFNPKEQKNVSQKERGSCLSRGYMISDSFLGGGAVGRVFLAEATEKIIAKNPKMRMLSRHGQPFRVAIKIIYADTGAHNIRKLAKYTPSEIGNMNRAFGHPNILMLFDVFIACKRIFIVTELAGQGSLKRFYRDNYISKKTDPFMTESEARYYFRETARGVTELHSQNIAHRDLKLDNVLITETGEVKLGDFGFSIRLSYCNLIDQNSTEVAKDIANTTLCGTPCFMAPEVLRNRGAYNAISADLWSLGVILYILVNGYYPYPGKNLQEVLQNAEKSRDKDLPFREHISDECKDLITKLLRFDAWKRPSAFTILQHPWLRGETTTPDTLSAYTTCFQDDEVLQIRLDPVVNYQEKYVRSYLLQRSEILNTMLKRIVATNTVPKSIISEFGVRLAIPRRQDSDDCIIKEVWRLMAPITERKRDSKEISVEEDKVLEPNYGLPWKSSWADGTCNSTIAVLPARRIIYELSILDNWRKIREANNPPLTELEKCIQLRNTVDLDENELWPLEHSILRPTAEWATIGENWGSAYFPRLLNETAWDGAKLSIQPLQDPIVDQSNMIVRYVPVEQPSNALVCFLQQMSTNGSRPLFKVSQNNFDQSKGTSNSSLLTFNSSSKSSEEGPCKAPVMKKTRLSDPKSHEIPDKIKKRRKDEEYRKRTLPSCAFYTPRGVKPTPKLNFEEKPLDSSRISQRNENGSTKIPSPRETWLHKKYSSTRPCSSGTKAKTNAILKLDLIKVRNRPDLGPTKIPTLRAAVHYSKAEECLTNKNEIPISGSSDALTNVTSMSNIGEAGSLVKKPPVKIKPPLFRFGKIRRVKSEIPNPAKNVENNNDDTRRSFSCSEFHLSKEQKKQPSLFRRFTHKLFKMVPVKPMLKRKAKYNKTQSQFSRARHDEFSTTNSNTSNSESSNFTNGSVSSLEGDAASHTSNRLYLQNNLSLSTSFSAKESTANQRDDQKPKQNTKCYKSSSKDCSKIVSHGNTVGQRNVENDLPNDLIAASHSNRPRPCNSKSNELDQIDDHKTENVTVVCRATESKISNGAPGCSYSTTMKDANQANVTKHTRVSLSTSASRYIAFTKDKPTDDYSNPGQSISWMNLMDNYTDESLRQTTDNKSNKRVNVRLHDPAIGSSVSSKHEEDCLSPSKLSPTPGSDDNVTSTVRDYRWMLDELSSSLMSNEHLYLNHTLGAIDESKTACNDTIQSNENNANGDKQDDEEEQDDGKGQDFNLIDPCYFGPTKLEEEQSESFSLSFEDYLNAVKQHSTSVSMQTSACRISEDENRDSTERKNRAENDQVEDALNGTDANRIVCKQNDESPQSAKNKKNQLEHNNELRQGETGIAKPIGGLMYRCMSWLTLSDTSTFAGSLCEEQKRRAKEKYGLGEDSIAFLCNNKINNDWFLDLSTSSEAESCILSHQNSASIQTECSPSTNFFNNVANADKEKAGLPGTHLNNNVEQKKLSVAGTPASNSKSLSEVVKSPANVDSFRINDAAGKNLLENRNKIDSYTKKEKVSQKLTSSTKTGYANKSEKLKTKDFSLSLPSVCDTASNNICNAVSTKATPAHAGEQQQISLQSHNSNRIASVNSLKDRMECIAENCEAEVKDDKNNDEGFIGLLKIRSELKVLEEKWNNMFASVCRQTNTDHPDLVLKFLKENNDNLPSESTTKESTNNSRRISQKIRHCDLRADIKQENFSPSLVAITHKICQENSGELPNKTNKLKSRGSAAALVENRIGCHELVNRKLEPEVKNIVGENPTDRLQESDKRNSSSRSTPVSSRNIPTRTAGEVSRNHSNDKGEEHFKSRDASQWHTTGERTEDMSTMKRSLQAEKSKSSKLCHPKNIVLNKCASLKDDIQGKVDTLKLLVKDNSEKTGKLISKKLKKPRGRTCEVQKQCSHISDKICVVKPKDKQQDSPMFLATEKCTNKTTSVEIQPEKSALNKVLHIKDQSMQKRNSAKEISHIDTPHAIALKKQRVSFKSMSETIYSDSNTAVDMNPTKKIGKEEQKSSTSAIHKQFLSKTQVAQQTNMASGLLARQSALKSSKSKHVLNAKKRPNLIQKGKDVCVTSRDKDENSRKTSPYLEKFEKEKILKHPEPIVRQRGNISRKNVGRKIQHMKQEVDEKLKKFVILSNDKLRSIRTCSKCKKLESNDCQKYSCRSTKNIPLPATAASDESKSTMIDIILALLKREMALRSSLNNPQSGEGSQLQKDCELEWFKTYIEHCFEKDSGSKVMLSKSIQTDRSFLQEKMSHEVSKCSPQPEHKLSCNPSNNVVITTSKTPTGITIDINATSPDKVTVVSGDGTTGHSVDGNMLISPCKTKKSLPKTIKNAFKNLNPFSLKGSAQALDNGDFYPLPLSSSSRQAYEDIDSEEPASDSSSSTVTLHRSKSFLESRITKLVSFVHKVKRVRKYFITKYGRGRAHGPDAPRKSRILDQPAYQEDRDDVSSGEDEEDEESEESISEYLFQIPEYLLEMPDLNFNYTESTQ